MGYPKDPLFSSSPSNIFRVSWAVFSMRIDGIKQTFCGIVSREKAGLVEKKEWGGGIRLALERRL